MSASMTRESSPPEAVSRTGAAGTPGFGRDQELDLLRAGGRELVARVERDLERRVLHRQLGELRQHALGERRRRLGACLRERTRERVLLLLGLRQRPLGALDRDLRVLEPVALGPAPLQVLEHRGDAAAVLSLEPVVRVEPLLDLLEPSRLGGEAELVAAQLARQVLGLDPERAQARREAVELCIHSADRRRQPLGLGEQRGGARGVGLGRDRLRPAGARGAQPLEVAKAVALCQQLGLLRLVRLQRLDLADLEDEQVEVALAVSRAPA